MMGKTYEAMMRAENLQREKNLPIKDPSKGLESGKLITCKFINSLNLENFEHLKTNIINRCRNAGFKTILFNGIRSGCGNSTTALGFAASIAKTSNLKVLLLEVNLRTPGLRQMLNIKNSLDLVESIYSPMQNFSKNQNIEFSNLSIICCGASIITEPLYLFESNKFKNFLDHARKSFDFVVLDAPPVPIFSDFRILCNLVDGVVLVILSEKIRRQVALRAKKEIEEAGGRVLGAVLNKRKYYIPNWLYKRL